MEKIKQTIMKILTPNLFFLILFDIIGFSMVTYSLINHEGESVFGYISYIVSAYALIITSLKVPGIYKKIFKKVDSIPVANKYINDIEFRTRVSLYVGIIINVIYAIFKVITGFIYKSIWFESVAIYYIIICIARYLLLKKFNTKKKSLLTYQDEIISYKFTGILILILNVAIGIMMIEMITNNQTVVYPGLIIYASATYTFYNLVSAIINIIKYRKLISPILSAVKYLGFIISIMALFSLQASMIQIFGSDEHFRLLMNSLSGAAVFLIGILLSITMIIKSKNKK